MKRIISLLSFLLICFNFFTGFTINSTSLSDLDQISLQLKYDEKINADFSIDEEFSDDTVIVVLKKACSATGHLYTPEDFKDIECSQIEDLTSCASNLMYTKINLIKELSSRDILEKMKQPVLQSNLLMSTKS